MSSDLKPALQWMIDRCKARRPATPKERRADASNVQINEENAIARGVHYLEHDAPCSIEGQGGNQTAYIVTNKLKDFGLSEARALDLMLKHWNPRNSPPWSFDDLRKIVANAFQYGKNERGCEAPEVVFAKAEKVTTGLNEDYAVVKVGSGVEIAHDTFDQDGNPLFSHYDVAAFKLFHAARKKEVDTWLTHQNRKTLEGYVFKPGQPAVFTVERNGQVKRYYNLWRPLPFAPAPSGVTHPAFERFIEHTNLNICAGNEALFRWVMGWCAQLIQTPWIKPHTAIVLRGGKGVGKNAWVECLRMLLGRHSLVTSDGRYMTGHFNSHFENLLLIVFDEASWPGDKAAEGALKNLITGAQHIIERKGKEPYAVDNVIRVIIIGNEDWLFPASPDERRAAIFDVGDRRKQDHPFFKALMEGMKNGGREVLLRYLLDYDIAGVNLNEAPCTSALLDQKIETLDPLRAFWYSCLRKGHIPETDYDGGWPTPEGGPVKSVECQVIQDAFKRELITRRIKSRVPAEVAVGRTMASLGVPHRRQRVDGKRVYAYDVPSLKQCREKWDLVMGQPEEWPE